MKNYELKMQKLREAFKEKYKDSDSIVDKIIIAKGYVALNDPEDIEEVCREVVEENPDKVKIYQKGKTGILGLFIKSVMEKTNNGAHPELTNEILIRLLKEGLSNGQSN